jgi:hypothetical protein
VFSADLTGGFEETVELCRGAPRGRGSGVMPELSGLRDLLAQRQFLPYAKLFLKYQNQTLC